MRVNVTVQVQRPGISARRLQHVVQHVLRRHRGEAGAEIGVALVSDRTIRALNSVFLHHDFPTDVLSFPTGRRSGPTSVGRGRYLGEIVISVDRARAQAQEVGHPVGTEIALLAVHGVLHLLGYNDHRPRQASRMARRQRTLLTEAGFEVAG
jgi:probable rRNA maturation factor